MSSEINAAKHVEKICCDCRRFALWRKLIFTPTDRWVCFMNELVSSANGATDFWYFFFSEKSFQSQVFYPADLSSIFCIAQPFFKVCIPMSKYHWWNINFLRNPIVLLFFSSRPRNKAVASFSFINSWYDYIGLQPMYHLLPTIPGTKTMHSHFWIRNYTDLCSLANVESISAAFALHKRCAKIWDW